MPVWRRAPWLLLALLLAAPAAANDGRDRHRARGPTLLRLFPDPGPLDGYRVLPADAPGGADGEARFRWAQPWAVALVRLAAARAAVERSTPDAQLMAIFDASAENGDTPVELSQGRPRGRHPGDSHDGGLNLDLGYFLTSLDGPVFTPDHAACRSHFAVPSEAQAPGAPPTADLHRCAGPADKLDAPRQAMFLLELARYDRGFGWELIEEIGVDREVKKRVLAQLRDPSFAPRYAEFETDVERLDALLTSDRWEGWEGSHHHHLHLRLRDMAHGGRPPWRVEKLTEFERTLDGNGGKAPALQAQLWSAGLERAVALEVLDPAGLTAARFRVGDGEWTEPDPAALPRLRAVIDLPADVGGEARFPLALAEITRADGQRETLRVELCLPPQPALLGAIAEPTAFRPVLEPGKGRRRAWLEVPAVALPLVTEVTWEVVRPGAAAPERTPGTGPRHEATLPWRPAPLLVRVSVLLSGRKTLVLPVFAGDR